MSWYRQTYLKSQDWKNLRAAMLSHFAPDGKCPACGKKKKLDVHHVRYRKLYDVQPEDLRVLCRACHKQDHSMTDHIKTRKHREIARSLLRKKNQHPNVLKGLRALGVDILPAVT